MSAVIVFDPNHKRNADRPPSLTDEELVAIRRILCEHDHICEQCPVAVRVLVDEGLRQLPEKSR